MDKFGTKEIKHVTVLQELFGTVISVRKIWTVQETESITRLFSSAYVQKNTFGMGISVWCNLIVAVVKSGTNKPSNVTVPHLLTGMDHNVFCVSMEKFGMILKINVNVEMEQVGMENSALLFRNAMVVLCGTKIPGHVNVTLPQFGTEDTVWLTLAKVDNFGMLRKENVFAQQVLS